MHGKTYIHKLINAIILFFKLMYKLIVTKYRLLRIKYLTKQLKLLDELDNDGITKVSLIDRILKK